MRVENVTYLVQAKDRIKVGEFGIFTAYVIEAKNNWNLQTVYAAQAYSEFSSAGLGYYTEYDEAVQIAITGTKEADKQHKKDLEEIRKKFDARRDSEE